MYTQVSKNGSVSFPTDCILWMDDCRKGPINAYNLYIDFDLSVALQEKPKVLPILKEGYEEYVLGKPIFRVSSLTAIV